MRPGGRPASESRSDRNFTAGDTLFLATDDCQWSYDELSARGVAFNDTPTVQPYGIDTSLRDPSGDNIPVIQVVDFDPDQS